MSSNPALVSAPSRASLTGGAELSSPVLQQHTPPPSAARKSALIEELFEIEDEELLHDYSCAVSESGASFHGRLYVTRNAALFFSDVAGKETRKVIPFELIVSLHKRNLSLFLHALEVTVAPRSGGEHKTVCFSNFVLASMRDDAHDAIDALMNAKEEDGDKDAWEGASASAADDGDAEGGGSSDEEEEDGGGVGQPSSAAPVPPRRSVNLNGVGAGRRRLHLDGEHHAAGASVRGPSSRAGGATAGAGAAPPEELFPRPSSHGILSSVGEPPTAASENGGTVAPSTARSSVAKAPTTAKNGNGQSSEVRPTLPAAAAAIASPGASAASAPASEAGATGTSPSLSPPPPPPQPPLLPPLPPLPPSQWERLGGHTIVCDVVLPVHPNAFRGVAVLPRGGTFSIPDLHLANKDRDISCTEWVADGPSPSSAAASTAYSNNSSSDASGDGASFLTNASREIKLIMPLSLGWGLPNQTRVEKVQSIRSYAAPPVTPPPPAAAASPSSSGPGSNAALHFLETTVNSLDVPFGSYFVVEEVWVVAPARQPLPIKGLPQTPSAAQWGAAQTMAGAADPPDSPGSPWTRFVVAVAVKFTKGTMMESTIRSQTIKNTTAFYKAYVERFAAFLKKEDTPALLLAANPPPRVVQPPSSVQQLPASSIVSPSDARALSLPQLLASYEALYAAREGAERTLRDERAAAVDAANGKSSAEDPPAQDYCSPRGQKRTTSAAGGDAFAVAARGPPRESPTCLASLHMLSGIIQTIVLVFISYILYERL